MTHDQNHRPPTSSTSLRVLSADGSPVPLHWVEDLFGRLAAILGNTAMATLYAGADLERVKAEWAEALATFTADEVMRGVSSVRLRKFAPNLPEFLHLCRPVLDAEVAWHEASNARGRGHQWSHPAVYWAASEMGYEMRNGTYQQHRKRWDALMAAQWQRRDWPAPPLQIPHTPRPRQQPIDGVPVPKEAVTAMLHDLRTRLTGHPTRAAEEAARGTPYTEAELADQQRAQQLAGGL
jgi:hypothetical protein